MAQVSFATIKKGVPKRRIVLGTFSQIMANELPTSAAAISYFAMLGLYPFLLLLYSLSQEFPKFREVNLRAIETVLGLLPTSRQVVENSLEKLVELTPAELISCIIIIIWVTSWTFTIIERAINRVWRTSCRSFWQGRLLSLAMMIVVGVLLALSSVITGIITFLQSEATRSAIQMEGGAVVIDGHFWQVVFGVVGLMLTISLFTLLYKIMPNTSVTVVEALPGAVLAGIAWELAKYLFAWALVKFPYDQLYGSIAAVVATLTWIYISSLIMLFGAQMTALLHCEYLMEEQGLSSPKVARVVARFGS